MYQFAWVRPLDLHTGIKLHHGRAVQCEGVACYQLHWVHGKELDIVNLAACAGKRSRGKEKSGRQWEADTEGGHSDIIGAFSFLTGPEEMTILWSRGVSQLQSNRQHSFHPCVQLKEKKTKSTSVKDETGAKEALDTG